MPEMLETLDIRTLGPDDPEFDAWHGVIAAAYAADREPGWWESLESTRASFAEPTSRTAHLAVVALLDGVVVGGAELGLPLDEDTQTLTVELGVDPTHRHAGIGSALAERVAQIARGEGREVVQAELFVPAGIDWDEWPGARLAGRYGLRSVSVEDRFLLDLPVAPEQLEALAARLPEDDDARLVSWVGPSPDDLLAPLATMRSQMNEDVPLGDLTRTARTVDVERIRESDRRMAATGWTKVRSVALDAAGAGLGYTQMFVSAHDPDLVVQDDTFVDRSHRGRRLGARLKVANLRLLHAHADDLIGSRRWVQTYTEQGNTAMQHTNEAFGFRRVDVLHQCEGRLPPPS